MRQVQGDAHYQHPNHAGHGDELRSMTRNDYELLARALGKGWKEAIRLRAEQTARPPSISEAISIVATAKSIEDAVIDMLAAQNSRFDKAKFKAAVRVARQAA